MEAANLSPSGTVLPLAATINGNNLVDEKTKTGVMQPEGETSRNVRILAGVLISVGTLAAIGTGIASLCVEDSSQRLGLGIAAGVLGGVTTVAGGLAMRYA
ncbi:SepZ/EspZ family type III secretion system protein [Escherichia coli]|nr:type III secretion system protein SepZ [Escherichia coli]EET2327348.1 type III secretion system protein SepZ [Escherichia coli]EFJ8539919.1 type III secretion system protein SepZ [Escherichia coli]EGL6880822.1 type III secretion system protein SepZ [Escherichia coli]EHK1136385.1 SepZ/EspZ family type III secretion system protein [Escherichia coli]